MLHLYRAFWHLQILTTDAGAAMFCALITNLTLAVILVSNVTKTVSYLSINPFDESNITGQISANELLRTW